MEEDRLTFVILGCAYKVHKALGPGLLENAYKTAFVHEARRNGLKVEVEKAFPLIYDGIRTMKGYRVDVLIEGKIVAEIKAEKSIHPVTISQMQTYLTLTGCRVGLILNFNVRWLKNGIRRVINPERPGARPPLR